MSKRLEVLKLSLAKKEAEVSRRIESHIEDVKRANGQPLNDKRNGRSTLNRWAKQEEAIKNAQKGIEVTKSAIEREEWKIKNVSNSLEVIPQPLLDMIEEGRLIQWRKHPLYFFVKGVDRCRIIWNDKKKQLEYKRPIDFSDADQWRLFARTYNDLNKHLTTKP